MARCYPGGRRGGGGLMWLQTVSTNLCRSRKKSENNFGRTVLKLCWVIIGWLPPSPVSCHQHRQQIHFILLFDNIYIVLTAGAQLFCHIQQLNTTQRKCIVVWKVCLVYSWWTHSRKWFSQVTVLLSSQGEKWWWHLQLQLCPVTGTTSLNILISLTYIKKWGMETRNLASFPVLAWLEMTRHVKRGLSEHFWQPPRRLVSKHVQQQLKSYQYVRVCVCFCRGFNHPLTSQWDWANRSK